MPKGKYFKGEHKSTKCAIIGDIKKSRNLGHWKEIFTAFQKTLDDVNRTYSSIVAVTFKPTVGDEFQGAIRTPEKAIEIYYFIKAKITVNMYFGIGIGEIEKPIDEELGMRGDAFYRARDALQLCKKLKRNIMIKAAPTYFLSQRVMNTSLHFIEVMENSWADRQREIIEYYRQHPNDTYEEVGKHFGFTKQAVSDSLIAANWKVVAEGIDLVQDYLKEIFSERANPN